MITKYPNHITEQIGAHPLSKEIKVAEILFEKTKKVVLFLVENRTKGAKTPDVRFDNLDWEIKTPTGNSSRTIENNLRAAIKQSPNIILDLRNCTRKDDRCLREIKTKIEKLQGIKQIIVITKNGKVLDFKK